MFFPKAFITIEMYLFKFKTQMVFYKTIISIKMFLNSKLGNNKSILIPPNNETIVDDFWIKDLPLKLITHGWCTSDKGNKGVFTIKTGLIFFLTDIMLLIKTKI